MNAAHSALADPAICPDCRQLLADSVCSGCGLDLNAPLGPTLWGVMLQADALVGRIRAEAINRDVTGPAYAPAYAPAAASGQQAVPSPETVDSLLRHPASRRVHVSVQAVLLALGGLLVTVAAVVFLAMSWSALGVGGRTAVLGAVTAALLGVAVIVTRRNLGASAETLWLLVAAMSVLDVTGAAHVGRWGLDRLSWVGLLGVQASILCALAATAVFVSRGSAQLLQPPLSHTGDDAVASAQGMNRRGPTGVQVAAALGLAAWFVANLQDRLGPLAAWSSPVRSSVIVLVASAVAYGLTRRRVSLPVVGAGAATGAAVAWCALMVTGVDRFAGQAGNYWSDLRGWPLLAAALPPALAAWGAASGRGNGRGTGRAKASSPAAWRTAAATVAVGLTLAFVAGPSSGDETALVKVALGTVAVAILAAVLLRQGGVGRSWFRATALWAAAGTATLGWLLVSVLGGVQEAVPAYGRGRADSVLEVAGLEPAWLVGLASASLVVVVGVAWTVSSFVRAHAVAVAAVSALLVGVGAYLIAALSGAPLWFLVTGSFLGAMGFFVAPAWIRTPARDRGLLLAMAGGTALLAAWDATGSHALGSALAGTAALLAAALVGIGVRRSVSLAPASWSPTRLIPGPTVQIAAGVLVIAVAAAWFEFAAATAMSSFVVAVVLAAWAAAAGLVAQWASHRPAGSVRGWAESASVLVGLAALGLVSGPSQAGVVLTLLGAAAAGVVLISADRLWCSWLAAVLLAAATLCRLVAGDPFPEAYALPVAALLVAGGWWRLRLEPAMSSFTALGAGLGLGFGPSLLLAWGDPLSGRALAVFVAALAVLAFGVWSRWAAPLWAGALAAGSLAVVNLFPTIYVLPRWVVLGAVGTILVGVGVTWEARLREARRAGHYLGLLR